jgi:hypothetical protein
MPIRINQHFAGAMAGGGAAGFYDCAQGSGFVILFEFGKSLEY